MKKALKHYFWLFTIAYGRVFGRAWLAPVHHAFLNLAVHALGYDNCYGSNTGEDWFITNVLKSEDIRYCMDIGANIGSYSRMLAQNLDAIVYAIEPASTSFAELQERVTTYGDRIRPMRYAVSDFDGEATLFSSDALSETATLGKEIAATDAAAEVVPVIRIDTLVARERIERIDFIKIDTEGFEREVIKGMQETIRTHKPKYIQLEFNHLQLFRGYTVYDLSLLLDEYELYRLLPRGLVRIQPKSYKDNLFIYSNLIAKRITC